ncbi:sugar transferase [Vibrio scophthalmi]|uniref:Exopolysaccharide production protein ExoY n=1 Tax=Vibrio scophthalmi TaxID=45658 RepID=A0A1E3WLT5_9VIBR|nr:sugar transferase [Vibrio scophthalmi]ODS09952.1 Exopolysaccharide production protein ExoY [Vibrio scophthalmi]
MLKRTFDIVSSFFGLVILFPVLLVIALWIKLSSTGPILFCQTRVGLNGQNFSIFKFRTMVVDAEKLGLKVTVGKDPRITTCGHFLRRYKLDELPQLVNVLLGTMSVVGPRPEVPEYMNEYPDEVRHKILSVRPGITDKASIEFTNESEILATSKDPRASYINEIMPTKAKYYIEYIDNYSFSMDISIVFQTINKIIQRR